MIIECKNISKIYHIGINEILAVNNLSINIENGEYIALMGTSGSGKSTLIHMMGGIERPSSGSILIDGNNIYTMSEDKLAVFRRRKIGLIYQFYNLIPYLTVEMNIKLPVLLDHKKCDDALFNNIVSLCGLSDRLSHLPEQLSGGQQQRTAIARSLVQHPDILLADEPTGNLDIQNTNEVLELFIQANKKYGQTIIMVTHDNHVASKAGRILYMEDGKLI
jgi:putative ABC transport system ATP-binding protein